MRKCRNSDCPASAVSSSLISGGHRLERSINLYMLRSGWNKAGEMPGERSVQTNCRNSNPYRTMVELSALQHEWDSSEQ
ncbi:hypothetical protein AOLI_G00149580 [Acnodon oligacanthus]